jgi:hypothetical protein
MKDFYKKYYTTEILEKIKSFGFNRECSTHIIELKDGEDIFDEPLEKKHANIPSPEEFFNWVLNSDKFYISIVPEDDYIYGVVFRYNIYEKDYDDHFNFKGTGTGFLTHDRAVENAVYDLLINFKPHN